jgi:hypothetical protein
VATAAAEPVGKGCGAGRAGGGAGRPATHKRMRTVIILCNTNNLNSYEFYSCATTYFLVLSMMVDARLK